MKIKMTFFILIILLFCHAVGAATLHGTFKFTKKPPLAGVIYQKMDSSKQIVAKIDQVNKSFTHDVVIASPNSNITFTNSDEFEHNIFANDLATGVRFDVGLMSPGGRIENQVDWKDDSLIRIGCKIHPKMKAYIANIKSDKYFPIEFKKQKELTFTIDGITSSPATFKLLLPKYDAVEVTVAVGAPVSVDLIRKGKNKGTLELVLQ